MKTTPILLLAVLLTASVALGQAQGESEHQVPVIEDVSPPDSPAADAAQGNAEAEVPQAPSESDVEQPPSENLPAAAQPGVEP